MPHQDRITIDDIDVLLENRDGPCISIYLPTTRVSQDTDESRIRLKSFRSDAMDKIMADFGLRRPDADELLLPVDQLLEDDEFWRFLSDGLAIFLAADASFVLRLGESFDPRLEVGGRFLVRPLLRQLSGDGVYHLLAVSRNEVRLLEGNRLGAREVTPDDMPRNMARALTMRGREGERMPYRQWHGDEGQKTLYRKFFLQIDRVLRPSYSGRSEPLVVAGVDYLLPIFRGACSYRHLVAEGIVGNPDELSEAELHEKAWPLVEPILDAPRRDSLERLQAEWGTKRVTDDVATILRAAYNGRVETLFLDEEAYVFGTFDTGTLETTVAEGDQEREGIDLGGIAGRYVHSRGGDVYAAARSELPGPGPLIALLRY